MLSRPPAFQPPVSMPSPSLSTEDRLRAALKAGRLGFWELELVSGKLNASEICKTNFGRPIDADFTYADLRASIHPDDSDRMAAAVQATLTTGVDYDIEYRLIRPDGRMGWIMVRGQLVRDSDGTPLMMSGISMDITARKEQEDALLQSRQKLDAIREQAELQRMVVRRTLERDRAWKHSLDLQLVIGPDGIITAANDAWLTLLGWRPDEVVGEHFLQFTHPDEREATRGAIEIARDDALRRFEKRCAHKTDGYRWISWVAAPEADSVYASGRDVTAERESTATLAALEKQLRQSQKMEALGQLTGGLAHDFNNYLGVISNSLMSLRQIVSGDAVALSPELAEKTIERGERASRLAAALTQRLLAFAREQPLRPEPTDLRRLLRDSGSMIRSSLPPSIAFDMDATADGACSAFVDANNLDNALLNLCINARDAMPDGGRLTVSATETTLDAGQAAVLDVAPGRYACIEVADTGIGMSDEVRTRIFDPFFTTKSGGLGTGLGLSMVYGFSRQSKGQVTADSTPGLGTVMRLYLPADERP